MNRVPHLPYSDTGQPRRFFSSDRIRRSELRTQITIDSIPYRFLEHGVENNSRVENNGPDFNIIQDLFKNELTLAYKTRICSLQIS